MPQTILASILALSKVTLGYWAKKRPAERSNSHQPENRSYPELPGDMGEIWSHWVRAVWAQKWGLYRCSVKRTHIFLPKMAPAPAKKPTVQPWQHDFVVCLASHHDGNTFFFHEVSKKIDFQPRNSTFKHKKAILGNRGHQWPSEEKKTPCRWISYVELFRQS